MSDKDIGDYYLQIEKDVNEFAQSFIASLPKDEDSSLDIRFIVDAILKIKEPSKFLVNNYLSRKNKDD